MNSPNMLNYVTKSELSNRGIFIYTFLAYSPFTLTCTLYNVLVLKSPDYFTYRTI